MLLTAVLLSQLVVSQHLVQRLVQLHAKHLVLLHVRLLVQLHRHADRLVQPRLLVDRPVRLRHHADRLVQLRPHAVDVELQHLARTVPEQQLCLLL